MYNRYLRDLIITGRAKPSFVVSHTVSLDEATEAYEKFDKRIDGYTKASLSFRHVGDPIFKQFIHRSCCVLESPLKFLVHSLAYPNHVNYHKALAK